MTANRSCVLLLRDGHFLNQSALLICRANLQVLAAVESRHVDEEKLAQLQPELVLSFLNEYILRGPLLRIKGINFHPAPPNYPGRGGASLALFDGHAIGLGILVDAGVVRIATGEDRGSRREAPGIGDGIISEGNAVSLHFEHVGHVPPRSEGPAPPPGGQGRSPPASATCRWHAIRAPG